MTVKNYLLDGMYTDIYVEYDSTGNVIEDQNIP